MTVLWLDTETYSEADLIAQGTACYAEHPSTEVMLVQWAFDDEPAQSIDMTSGVLAPPSLMRGLLDPAVTIAAHNAFFDRTLLRRCLALDLPPERWFCVMVQALAHGLPGALGKLGPLLGLPSDAHKDKRGRDLIHLFCKPRPKNSTLRRATRETHPKEWAEFCEYSLQDVPAMRAVSKALPQWNYALPGAPGCAAGHRERALWYLDQRINDRGFAVDLDLALAATRAAAEQQALLREETRAATGGAVASPTQRDQLLAFILAEHGVALPDMKADTLRRRAEDPELPDAVRLLINLRLEATKTSVSKYKAALAATSGDGRLRGTLQFAGAARTERWAGRIFQPQNMMRPTLPQVVIDAGIAALKGGYENNLVPLVADSVMELTANAVRGCIVAPPGRKLVIADLANIEGRGLVFLSGEEWKLQAFRDYDAGVGPDLYVASYVRSFNTDAAAVTKKQRQIGKVQELGLGYEGGVAAFLTFAAVYNMALTELAEAVWATSSRDALDNAGWWWAWAVKRHRTLGLSERVYVACQVLVSAWRAAHPLTVALWKAAKEQVCRAILSPGVPHRIGQHLIAQRDGAWLRIRLPSGRCLCYLNPRIGGEGEDEGQITYSGISQYTKQWTRIKTYGGKLIENATQAAARDVLAENMPAVEAAGYRIVMHAHDELITEAPDSPEFNPPALAALMTKTPTWAQGLPLAAAGFETYRYQKEQ